MFITSRFPSLGFDQFWISPPEYFEFTEWNRSFSRVGAFTTGELNLSASDRPRRVRTGNVDAALLKTLGVPAARGRHFTAEETRTGGPDVAMLSHETWQAVFGGRDVVGQTMSLNGRSWEVVGIMPPGFDVMDNKVEVWLPLRLDSSNRSNRGNHGLYLIGRLADGRSMSEAQAEISTLYARWEEQFPKTHKPSANFHQLQMEPAQAEIVGSASRAIWVLQAAVGFVLLIACANLANLLLARAETRHREFAVRAALGAGRWRLLRQFMTEGIVLSLAGGVLGLAVAVVGLRLLLAAYPESLPRSAEVSLDPMVLGFTLLVSLATGIVFGLAPLLHLSPDSLAVTLARERRPRLHRDRLATGCRRGLVMAEVALAVMLVVGAGLMLRTVVNLMRGRCRLRPRAVDDVCARPADGHLRRRPGRRALLRRARRAAAAGAGCGRRRGDVGPAAEPASGRQRHRHRGVREAVRGGPDRKRRLLPVRLDRLLRDDGHPHRRGTGVRVGRPRPRTGGGDQRGAGRTLLPWTQRGRRPPQSGSGAVWLVHGHRRSPRTSSKAAWTRRPAPRSTSLPSKWRRPASPSAT